MGQGADIEFADAVTLHGRPAGGEQVTGGDNRDRTSLPAQRFGDPADHLVVLPDPLGQFGVLGLDGLTGLDGAQVTIVQVGHSANNRLRLASRIAQDDHFICRVFWQIANDMDIEHLQQGLGRIEERGGIVVAGDDNHVAAAGKLRNPV